MMRLEQIDLGKAAVAVEPLFREGTDGWHLAEAIPDLVCVVRGGKITFTNSGGVRLLGADTPWDLAGTRLEDLLAPEYRPLAEDGYQQWLEEREPLPIRLIRFDGKGLDVEARLRPVDGDGNRGFMLIGRDVTERKRSATALFERERRLAAVMENVADGLITIDEKGRIESFNRSAEKIFGHSASAAIGQSIGFLMSEPDRSRHDSYIDRYLETGETGIVGDSPRVVIGLHKDGSAVPLELAISEIRLGGKRLFIGAMRDVAERKFAERALRQSEQRFKDFAESASDWLWEMGPDLRFTYFSDRFYDSFGFSPEDVIGRTRMDLLSQPDDDAWYAHLEEIENRRPFQDMRYEAKLPEGRLAHFSTSGRPIFDANGAFLGYRGTARDITIEVEYRHEVEVTQAQLRESEKLNALGQLAGGVAHDFNNILMIIGGYTRIAREDPQISQKSRDALADVLKAAEKAAGLTRQLLVFGRRHPLESKVVAVSDILGELSMLLGPLLGETIDLDISVADEEACVETDPTQFTQALVNLAINARDAMPAGGKIAIGMDVIATGSELYGKHPDASAGSYVRVAVEDAGTGMDAETEARIFEPFFTTKEQGKGTGLGMAMVYGFVQESGGIIDVETELGKGTTIIIHLPLADRKPEIAIAVDPELPRGKGETILLSEDDDSLRHLVQITLEELGYHVLAAADGFEALEVEEEHDGPIALLLSDVVMPNMGGIDLSRALKETRPDTKILFMSGYPSRGGIKRIDLPEDVRLLQKPLDPEHLAHAVHEILEHGGAPARHEQEHTAGDGLGRS
ncbi:MAG: PAS domain S-box protein [Proteobacteria bacterium]|nr:PAS domain S-box protein [Pseudomonadota bacterium]